MPEHQEPCNVSNENEEHWPYIRTVPAKVWVIWSILLFAALAGFVAHYYVNEHSAKIKFFSDATFSFAALAVIITQAVIYSQQRDALKRQIEIARIAERGYIGIKNVALINFAEGQRPFINVEFLNGGRTPVWGFRAPAVLRIGVMPPNVVLPRTKAKEHQGFIPAGIALSIKYDFPEPIDSATVLKFTEGFQKLYLFGETTFEDCWGEAQTYSFKLVCRPSDGKFEEYDEPDTEAEVNAEAN